MRVLQLDSPYVFGRFPQIRKQTILEIYIPHIRNTDQGTITLLKLFEICKKDLAPTNKQKRNEYQDKRQHIVVTIVTTVIH